jgi:hypothetical protein
MFNGQKINKIMFNGSNIVGGYFNGAKINLQQILTFLAKDITVTRAGLSTNPLQRYSFTGGDVIQANSLVKHGESFFVGGDVATYEFDFGLKVAGSVVECPMKIYRTTATSIQNPSSYTPAMEYADQAMVDKIKTQDGTLCTPNASGAGGIAQLMIELDLTPLCNLIVSGSNSAFKSLIKSITADVWAMGSGSNGGVLANGVNVKAWDAVASEWSNTSGKTSANSTSPSIAKLSLVRNDNYQAYFVNTSNKLYILIASQYASDGTIPSSVSLDYLNISISLTRMPDVVQPIPVNLPKYWAMVVKGFSPSWDSNKSGLVNRIFAFYTDANNRISLYRDITGEITLLKRINSTLTTLKTSIASFGKNQIYNFVVGQNTVGMFIYMLKNNSILEKYNNTNTTLLQGQLPLQLFNQANAEQADAFAESFHLIDLERMGKVKFGPELVLNGDFSNGGNGWTPTGIFDFNLGKARATASGKWSHKITRTITELKPNTTYIVSIGEMVNALYYITGKTGGSNFITDTSTSVITFTTTTETICTIGVGSIGLGEIYVDNISLKQVIQDGFSDGEAVSILKGQMHIKENNLVVNGDFSNGTTGWNRAVAHGRDSTISASSNTLTVVGASASQAGVNSGSGVFQDNKKYYCRCIAKVTNDICQSISLRRGANTGIITINNPVKNQQYTLSGVITTGIVGTESFIQVFHQYVDNATATGKVMEIQQVSTIDLTALFGAGNEPTLAQCDAMFAQGSTNPIGLTNPELFDINKVTLHTDASMSNGVIMIKTSGNNYQSYVDVLVLPNNKYNIKTNMTGFEGSIVPYIIVDEYYNNILIGSTNYYTMTTPSFSQALITKSNTNKLRIKFTLYNNTATMKTFTFSDMSIRRRD